MGDTRNEPSMDDILASIKRIISDDGAAALNAARARAQPAPPPEPEPEPAAEDVLELTDPVAEPAAAADEPAEAQPLAPPAAPQAEAPAAAPEIVSPAAAAASRQSLAALSAVVVRPDPDPGANTLEALVRELLRPMLREWLDANLPALVDELVSREIARITGKPR